MLANLAYIIIFASTDLRDLNHPCEAGYGWEQQCDLYRETIDGRSAPVSVMPPGTAILER